MTNRVQLQVLHGVLSQAENKLKDAQRIARALGRESGDQDLQDRLAQVEIRTQQALERVQAARSPLEGD